MPACGFSLQQNYQPVHSTYDGAGTFTEWWEQFVRHDGLENTTTVPCVCVCVFLLSTQQQVCGCKSYLICESFDQSIYFLSVCMKTNLTLLHMAKYGMFVDFRQKSTTLAGSS